MNEGIDPTKAIKERMLDLSLFLFLIMDSTFKIIYAMIISQFDNFKC